MSTQNRTPERRAARFVVLAAAVEAVIGAAIALTPNPEGGLGGLLFASLYALPLAGIALLLRARGRAPRLLGGLLGGLLAVGYGAIPIVNSLSGGSGYSTPEAFQVIAATVPAVAGGLAAFWAGVLRRGSLGTLARPFRRSDRGAA